MRIEELNISYGGYLSRHYEVSKHWNKLAFKTWDDHPSENPPVFVKLSSDQWKSLVARLIEIIIDWQPCYDSDICDGTQWRLVLQTGTHKIKVDGSNNFPDNFDDLVHLIRGINFKQFAEGHLDEDEFIPDTDSHQAS